MQKLEDGKYSIQQHHDFIREMILNETRLKSMIENRMDLENNGLMEADLSLLRNDIQRIIQVAQDNLLDKMIKRMHKISLELDIPIVREVTWY